MLTLYKYIMAGGLIQIVTYGSQDLYLTGTPEITFFKVVYRRHTNFSIESVRVTFDDPTGFGLKSSLTVPKTGDLIHKTYLEVKLPAMNLKRIDTSNDLKPVVDQAATNFDIVQSFMSLNRRSYGGAASIFEASNSFDSSKLINQIDLVFNEPGASQKIEDFQNLLATTPNAPFLYDEVSMKSVADSYSPLDIKQDLFSALSVALDKSQKTQEFFFIDLRTKQEAFTDQMNDNIKFAWVSRVGHAIIDEIEIMIGGSVLDRHLGDWINIWYELTAKRDLEKVYFKMIGNVDVLTDFDRTPKPSYLMRIPLQFWFCRYNGLAIPLVALEYHDVTFNVKFRKLEQVSYVEFGQQIRLNNAGDVITLSEVSDDLGLDIEATMLIDYIYLDTAERRRFAQASHEYLIEQLQILELPVISQKLYQINLNKFVLPCKEMVWIAQKQKYTVNPDGTRQTQFNNYSLTDGNKGNPIAFSKIDFHSYERVPRLDGNYFNYVQPYQHHNTTPSDGINMYSYSIFPEEFQPSGSANVSQLSRINLTLEFRDELLLGDGTYEPVYIRVYVRNLNILRIFSGMGSPAATFGAG
jgi:hypothetical protein